LAQDENEEGESGHVFRLILKCESCKNEFDFHFQGPAAIQCTKCGNLFDARLQMYKELRKYFRENVESPY